MPLFPGDFCDLDLGLSEKISVIFENCNWLCSAPEGSSSIPKTLVWLRLSWRERYEMVSSFLVLCFGLILSLQEVKSDISFMFQTVAECVLFYYLTKKNENYKNIVRRNYRRRGRSQVLIFLIFQRNLKHGSNVGYPTISHWTGWWVVLMINKFTWQTNPTTVSPCMQACLFNQNHTKLN